MELGNHQHILHIFQDSLCKNYASYCELHSLEESYEGFLDYLVDHNFLVSKRLRDYAVYSLYQQLSQSSELNKTQLVQRIADRFNLSERLVWNALRGKS